MQRKKTSASVPQSYWNKLMKALPPLEQKPAIVGWADHVPYASDGLLDQSQHKESTTAIRKTQAVGKKEADLHHSVLKTTHSRTLAIKANISKANKIAKQEEAKQRNKLKLFGDAEQHPTNKKTQPILMTASTPVTRRK